MMNYESWKGEKYNSDLSTTEIAKLIREQLKKEFPNVVFSVRSEYFSMGSSITISVMKTPFKVILPFEQIPKEALLLIGEDRVKEYYKETHHQLNEYAFNDGYDKAKWNNGIFLTEEGYKFLKRVVEIVKQYNRTESDIQTDYYNTNFYFMLELGKWNKPFEDGD